MKRLNRSEEAWRQPGSTHRQSLARWGENLAMEYLSQRGYLILECNARTPYGEIDLVTRQDILPDIHYSGLASLQSSVTVFVEVKTRSSEAFGMPEEAITARKKAHLLASAEAYLQIHPELDGDWRVDVIAIQRFKASQKPNLVHFENAVT